MVASTLQLSGSDPSQELSKGSFAGSFSDVTKKLGDLGLWDLQDTISTIALIALGVAVAAAIGAVALARNRRRTIWWIGWTIASVGVFAVVLLFVGGRYAERQIDDPGPSAT